MEDYQNDGACDQYSARLSKINDMSKLLGSGVLLIRKKEQRAMLLTCIHVLEKIGDHDSFQAVFFADPNHDAITFQKNSYLRKGENTAQDYILYGTPWKSWMGMLADTCLAAPQINMDIKGFGCPDKYNGCSTPSNPFEGGDILKCYISNATPNSEKSYFYCHLKDTHSGVTDLNLQGFSGTGLFNENQCLVGIVKGKNETRINLFAMDVPAYDPEFIALNVSSFLSVFPSYNDRLWESTAIVHCLSAPFFRRGVYTENAVYSGVGLLNLWSVLLTIQRPLVLFLFGGSDDLKSALKKISLLSPHWETFSVETPRENEPPIGAEHSAHYGEGFVRVRQKLRSWRRSPGKSPILIHIDITFDVISHLPAPPSPMELFECVKRMGGCPDTDYVFLSDDYIEDFLCRPEVPFPDGAMSQREMIHWFWKQRDSTMIAFEEFDDEVWEIYRCVENLRQWIKDKNWETLSDFLIDQDSSALYLREVITWLNDGEKDAYQSLMTSLSKRNPNSVCWWLLLLCCRWSIPLLRDISEGSFDFQLLASLWEDPEQARDATLSQIAATVRRLALI